MVERDKIVKFCENYLQVKNFDDYCVNGLQVEGADKINKVIVGVSLSQKLIKAAIVHQAQMIMVHHGIFKNDLGIPLKINGHHKSRLKLLLENDISLCGFHLPLDAHPLIGNNASISKVLGMVNLRPCYVGFVGDIKKAMKFTEMVKLVNQKLKTRSFFIPAGPKFIKRVGIISGGASTNIFDAHAMGADTFICGEIKESYVRAVEEIGINFINAGHYNTEKLGIQNLGELVAKKFKVEVDFVDIPNDI